MQSGIKFTLIIAGLFQPMHVWVKYGETQTLVENFHKMFNLTIGLSIFDPNMLKQPSIS